MGKAPQAINHELQLGCVQLKIKTKYSAILAQERHEVNKRQCGRKSKLTPKLKQMISDGVRGKQSFILQGFLDVRYHELLSPHYKKAKKLRKTQPKRPFGCSIEKSGD